MEKNMKCMALEKGGFSMDQEVILKEQTRFYTNLYSSDKKIVFKLQRDPTEAALSPDDSEKLEGEITLDEFFDTVMTLKGGKVPGYDGLTIEYYRRFWRLLGSHMVAMFQLSFETGLLPESVRQGLILLLPKKQKDTRFVKNMRPLTLLNNDYKILAKAIDNRICEKLPKIINSDQTGFVKGRKISHKCAKIIRFDRYCQGR